MVEECILVTAERESVSRLILLCKKANPKYGKNECRKTIFSEYDRGSIFLTRGVSFDRLLVISFSYFAN